MLTGSVFLKAGSEIEFLEGDDDKGVSLESIIVEGKGRNQNWAKEEVPYYEVLTASPDLGNQLEWKWPFRAVWLQNKVNEPW